MGDWAVCFGACVACRRVIGFNPHRVPSYDNGNGKEPICRDCMERINSRRKAMGLPTHEIHPDAYEPLRAEDL